MKTLANVLRDNREHTAIINAVVKQLGVGKGEDLRQQIDNVIRGGADSGISGFVYYHETLDFAKKNRRNIVKLLTSESMELGEDEVTMVSNFRVFKNSPMDSEDKQDLYRYLGGGKITESNTITNVMAWFALEEVARMFED